MAAVDMNPPPEWPCMPTRSISIHGVACGELLCGDHLVFESVVAQISVAVVVVPLRAVGMTAAVADGNDDETYLRQTVDAVHVEAPRGVDGLGLGAGINIFDYGVSLRRVEVVGLVHHAVEVRNAVGGLDGKGLGKLVAYREQRFEVDLFQLVYAAAVGRIEVGCGCGVYARAGGGKEAAVVRQRERTVEARPVETSESRAVVVDAVEVVVVGISSLS